MSVSQAEARTIDVVMPQLGESVDAGTITRWLKALGESVAVDEPLYEVSSDKATMEVPSLVAGNLREILAQEGAAVAVGSVVARIASAQERLGEKRESGEIRERLSPVVRRLLREHGLDAAAIAGSAENGRITKNDILAHVNAPATHLRAAPARAEPAPTEFVHTEPVYEESVSKAPPIQATSHRVKLSPSRLRANERLFAAQKAAIDVFSAIEIDLEAVAAERARRGFTYLPFIARATIDALRTHKLLNASLDEANEAITLYDDVHLGIAVDLDEGGLVVPVVRNAERRTLDGLAAEIARLADGARTSKLRPDDYAGSTFTISNNGAFGTLLTAPVINPPNVAIVSTDAIELRPVVIDGMIAIRHRMYFCMTWDHRAFDGSTAARFLARVKHNLGTWDWSVQ